MKKMLLLLVVLTTARPLFSQTTLLTKIIEVNNIRYDYRLIRKDEAHVMFSLCPSAASAGCNPGKVYLNDLDKSLFDVEFKAMLSALDSNLEVYVAANAANDSVYKRSRDAMYTASIARLNEKTPDQKRIEALTSRLQEVTGETSVLEPVGTLSIPDKIVTIFNKNGTMARQTKVKQVEATIKQGSIARRGLKITMDDGTVFFNRKSPVNFGGFFKNKRKRMERFDHPRDSALYVSLRDVLDYNFFGSINYPSDGTHTMTSEERMDTLRVGTSLNNLVEMAVYSDLLGLLGRKPNGLIQSEISGNFITNTGSCKNSDIVFHNFIKPYIRLSKFDSKFGSLDSSSINVGTGKKDTINRTYLNQVSYLQAGIKMNLVRFGIGINQAIYVNVGADINLVNADSLYSKDLIFFNYYPEFNYTVNRIRNFGMDASLKFLRQKVADNDRIVNREALWVFNPSITLSYYPTGKEQSKVYFRFSYFDNQQRGIDNFSQFQVGYKTGFKIN